MGSIPAIPNNTTSIPQKSGNLPQKSGTYTRKIRKYFLLQEASRLLFKFYVRSYIRTFISFRMYYRIPPPPNIIFIGAVESPVRVGLPKNPEINTKKIRKFIPKKSRNSYQKNPEIHTKKIQKFIPKKSRNSYQKNPENITTKIQKT